MNFFKIFLYIFPKVAFITMTKFLGTVTYTQSLKPFHRNENLESEFQPYNQEISYKESMIMMPFSA